MERQDTKQNLPATPNQNNISNSRFHLVLFSDADEMFELWLPTVAEGFFRFSDSPEHRFLSISGKEGQWVAACRKPAFFQNVPLEQNYEIILHDSGLLKIDADDRLYTLLIEQVSPERMAFHNYFVRTDMQLDIGSQPGCAICCDSPYISRKHAALTWENSRWKIRDLGSVYGIYVNGVRRNQAELQLGDTVFIMGLRIIVGPRFLCINDGSGNVKVDPNIVQENTSFSGGYSRYYANDFTESHNPDFNRLPRKKLEVGEKTIKVEAPPVSMDPKKMPLLLRMGSSMIMGGTAAMAGNYTMLLTSVMFPFLSQKYTDKELQEYEHLRQTKYTAYLEEKQREILSACQEERRLLNRKYPALQQVVLQACQKQGLWERRPIDSDFLQLRLGTGTGKLSAKIDYPPRQFELEPDELAEKMYQMVEREYLLEDTPIVLSLTETTVCGLLGERQTVLEYIQQLVVQITVLHSYDEVKLVFLLDPKELAELDALRYLPHVWDDQRSIRFIATNEAEAYEVGEYLQGQLETEKDGPLKKVLQNRPYYLIFALNKKLFDSYEGLKDILQSENNRGVSIISAYDDLPKETQKIITLGQNNTNTCTTMQADGGEDVSFRTDLCYSKHMAEALKVLSNTSLKTVTQAQALPKMVTFLEMFGVGRIEQLNPLKRWKENDPVKSLAAPVGVGADGTPFMLDLHEKRQGPHGLVAGMTGSGKSEFIITYILSMAVNYHPDEVAFLLIDYKGGGLADAFENPRTGVKLPHLAGTITNLDGASIQRSLMSIESELVRRQKVFSDVSKEFDEGSMNIYTYQKLYRAGKVSKPMPHLFIISDEFAELKQQQPEFMDKLISAARIGRSLGVHLILATQKPSGVVNDQIRSNTKFRVCLRVQDRGDSMDMLKRPEAAELTDTGRFYLQVGYNEYFALAQSAWCGADYEPQDTVPVKRDDAVEFLDTTGQIVTRNKPKVKKVSSGMSQIGAVVQYLTNLAKNQNIQSHSLWAEPLSAKIEYADLAAEYGDPAEGITALIGLADDPMHQTRLPLHLDLLSFHHMALVGLAGSGKSNFFKTMLYSLVMKLTPEEVNFYILDLSGGILSAFKNMPHCGAYLTKENEADFDRLLTLIQEIVDERKKLFADAEVYSYDDYMKIRKLPLALVILDGWSNILDFAKGQQYSLGISKYMREATNYGVRFLFSVNHLNEFSSKVNQELDYKIALQAKDKFEYNDILSLRNAILPPEVPGRGLCNIDGHALEYHVAMPHCQLDVYEQALRLREDLQNRASQLHDCKTAKCLSVVDEKLEYASFCSSFAPDRIPLGFSMQTMQPVAIPLQQLHAMSIYLGNPIGVRPVISNVLSAFHRERSEVIILRRASGTIFDRNEEKKLQAMYADRYTILDTTAENVPKLFELLVTEYIPKYRIPYRNEYCELHGIPATDKGRTVKAAKYIRSKTTPLLVLFESFADLIAADKDAVFADVFGMLRGFNIYFTGCFYPEDDIFSANQIFRSFSKDDFALLFGGQFHKQWVTSIPSVFRSMEKLNPNYNRFVMKYRSECHRMVMPCGELISMEADPDEKEIV